MYNAPSVAYPVGRCSFQQGLFVALSVTAMSVMVAWATYQPLAWPWYLACLAVCAGCVGGWRALQTRGVLQWNGQTWVLWLPSVQAVHPYEGGVVRVAFDAQQVLLLQWTPSPDEQDGDITGRTFGVSVRSVWLWLAKENAPDQWQDFRRAVHAGTPVF